MVSVNSKFHFSCLLCLNTLFCVALKITHPWTSTHLESVLQKQSWQQNGNSINSVSIQRPGWKWGSINYESWSSKGKLIFVISPLGTFRSAIQIRAGSQLLTFNQVVKIQITFMQETRSFWLLSCFSPYPFRLVALMLPGCTNAWGKTSVIWFKKKVQIKKSQWMDELHLSLQRTLSHFTHSLWSVTRLNLDYWGEKQPLILKKKHVYLKIILNIWNIENISPHHWHKIFPHVLHIGINNK